MNEPLSFEPSKSTGPDAAAVSWELPGGRYQVVGEIARGGMGVVLRAIDVDLQRPLAIKAMLRSDARALDVERFLAEARITGQLQHPGIAPVHEIGRLADGRAFFAMKLVEGRTLDDLLDERLSPQADLPRFLSVFEQIAQTLAFAHAQGVIHRDLKPSNIMVGAFGEVQVMDWGLAKRLNQADQWAEAPAETSTEERPEARPTVSPPPNGAQDATLDLPSPAEQTVDVPAPRGSTAGSSRLTQAGQVLGTPAFMPPEQARGEIDILDERADVFGLGAILSVILTGQPPYCGNSAIGIYCRAVDADLADALTRLDACGADEDLVALCTACLEREPASRPRNAGMVTEKVTAYLHSVEERRRQAELASIEAKAKAAEERKRRKLVVSLAVAVVAFLALAAVGGLVLQQQAANRRAEQARHELERRQAVEAGLDKIVALQNQARWIEARAVLEQTLARLGDADDEELRARLDQAASDLELVARLDAIRLQRATIVQNKLDRAGTDKAYAAAFGDAGLAEAEEKPDAVAARIRASSVRDALVAALDDWAGAVDDPARQASLLSLARLADPDPDGWRDRVRDPALSRDRTALVHLAKEVPLASLTPQLLYAIGSRLSASRGDSLPFMYAAQAQYPNDLWLNLLLASELNGRSNPSESVGYYRAALAIRPDTAAIYNNLALPLVDIGRVDEAIDCLHKAIALDSKFPAAYNNLGMALQSKGRLDDAIAEYRKALALNADYVKAHSNLANVLLEKGLVDEAIVHCNKAIDLDPDEPKYRFLLANALRDQRRPVEALLEYQKVLKLDSKYVKAYVNRGAVLQDLGRLDEAIIDFRQAARIDERNVSAHFNLGIALVAQGRPDEALPSYYKVIELRPKYADAYNNLGIALRTVGRLADAIAAYRKAIELQPDFAKAYCNLGHVLRQSGKLEEALAALKRGHELGSAQKDWRHPSTQWVKDCEHWLELEARLPQVLHGESRLAKAEEQIEFARLCHMKGLYAVSAKLWADAFSADPKLGENWQVGHRYYAARAAVLAAADPLVEHRTRWRSQALDWLRADLKAFADLLAREPKAGAFIAKTMRHSETDPELASVREVTALKRLATDEQASWRRFWAEVETLRKNAERARPKSSP